MNFENLNIWCWIIPALVGIISGILGYLIGKAQNSDLQMESPEAKKLEEENAKLKADLEACTQKLSAKTQSSVEKTALTSSPKEKETKSKARFDANAAKAAFGKRVKENDLKLVEGIGPKIEGLFHNFGIKTWKALSEVSTDKCQEVLNSGGDRYRIHDPASWPMQAKMAHKGQWKELAKWQDDHKAGKF
ncbi:hypothetical protein [Flagellimonas allohymeniacidonis]|uniref:LSU ribosomal protein L21p n=1 Tax=Flagellimonas allohymeniacidonis TaxID=2517819 RepID=A0A4Q8QBQ5_9FLAO|nr:hypothetical protein [Allomuricauda hymeniacidonis]TAI47741.1 hypothetical protein EW142_13870 [Allomuricauda hymeniacidonis]